MRGFSTFSPHPLFSYTFSLCSLDFGVARTAVFAIRSLPKRSWKGRRPQNRRSALLDISCLSFVFIDILALFPRFWCSAVPRVCGPRLAQAIMERPQTAEPAVCATRLLDFLTPRLLDCTWKQEPQAGATDENRRRLSGMTCPAGTTPRPTPHNKSSLYCIVCQEKNAPSG